MTQPATEESVIQVRYALQKKAHDKLRKHMRKLIAKKNEDVTMEQALNDLLINLK